jgi:hypothetical protein
VYANFDEASDVNEGFALDSNNQQKLAQPGNSSFDTLETWADANQGDGTFDFTASSGWSNVEDAISNGDYFVSAPVPDRGANVFYLYNGVEDFVVNNVTTYACRGGFCAARTKTCLYVRLINNNILRTGGRIMGSASDGVNHKAGYSWYENNTFEYTRDDAIHIGGGDQADPLGSHSAFRNNTVEGALRNSCWIHTDRSWITNNTLKYGGITGINIGSQGTGNDECRMMDVGLIENNLIIHPSWRGIMTRTTLNQETMGPDPVTGYYNRYLTITNNEFVNHQQEEGMYLTFLKDCTVSDNIVDNNSCSTWSVYSDSDYEFGIYCANSINVDGTDNIVSDTRIGIADWLVIDSDTCNDVTISLSGGLIEPYAATASDYYNGNRIPLYAINLAGMTDSLAHANDVATDQMWMGENSGTPKWFKVDLGAIYDVNHMVIYNFNWSGYTSRGCKNVNVYSSDSGSDPGNPVDNPGNWTAVGSAFDLTQAPGASDYGTTNAVEPDVVDINSTARWISLKINSNQGGGFCGLSEILFYGTGTGGGGAGGSTSTYNFEGVTQATNDHYAYYCDVDKMPFESSSDRNSFIEADDGDYLDLDEDDSNRWITSDPDASDEVFLWIQMNIDETPADITQIDLKFNGYSEATMDHRLYVKKASGAWDSASSWVQVGSDLNIISGTDGNLTRSITSSITDYIDGSGNIIWGVSQRTDDQDLRIDYVEMVVTYEE